MSNFPKTHLRWVRSWKLARSSGKRLMQREKDYEFGDVEYTGSKHKTKKDIDEFDRMKIYVGVLTETKKNGSGNDFIIGQ